MYTKLKDKKVNNAKSNTVDSVNNIRIGNVDTSGNKIINILAKYDEFAIYEIESQSIENRIKIHIDGHTDESEKLIRDRFNEVKLEYISAKGLLFHSSNFETNKFKVAHTLSTYLTNDNAPDNLFKDLIDTIQKEKDTSLENRLLYFLPSITTTIQFFILCLIIYYYLNKVHPFWEISYSLLSASLGGAVSIIINSKKLDFQQFSKKYFYIFLGAERVFFSICTGAIAFVLIKAEVIKFSFVSEKYWSFMIVLIVAGFSENYIPSILSKSEENMPESNKL